jgi:hypothetical protein
MTVHKKIYVIGILLVCGFLLTSVDDCESWYMAEQEQAAQIAQAEQERANQERLRQEERAKQEQAALTNRQTSQGSSVSQSSGTSQSQTGSQSAGAQTNQSASGSQSTQSTTQGQNQAGSQTSQSQSTAVAPSNQGSTQGASQSQDTQGGGAAIVQGGAASGTSEESTQTGATGASYLSTITGKEWKLSEVRLPGKTILVDRNKLTADKMGDLFTFTVDNSRISGKAAPNRYTSVYQAGANNALTIQPPISTLMASIYDPERIREREYFQYISRVKSWKLNQGKLELYTTDASNKEVVLVYGN